MKGKVIFLFLAWKEIRYAKMKFLLIVGIITLITSLVLSISGLANGLSVDNASAIKNMSAPIYVVEKSDTHQLERSQMTEEDISSVKGGSPLGLKMVEILHEGEEVNISLFALVSDSSFLPAAKDTGKLAPYEVFADSGLKKEGFEVGDSFTYKDRTWKIKGFTEKRFSYGHTPSMFTTIETWKDLYQDDLTYQAVLLTDEVEVNTSKLDAASKEDILSNVPGYSAEQGSLNMMVVFLLIISAIVLATFFYVMTLQKLHQYGVLKAIGTKASILLNALFTQISILSLLGVVTGNILTYGLTVIIPGDVPFELSIQMILVNSGLILLMAWIGSLLSFRSIMKVDPLDAIGGVK